MARIGIGEFLLETGRDGLKIGLSLTAIYAGFKPPDHLEERFSPIVQDVLHGKRQDLCRHGGWKPYIRTEDGADAEESLGGNTDGGKWDPVDDDGSADNACILVEANLPRVVAEDRDGRATGRADFSGQKETPFDRLETESLKVTRRHKLSKQALGSGVFSEGKYQWRRKAAKAAERGIPALKVLEVQIRGWQKTAGLLLALGLRRIQGDEMRRVRRRERMQKDGIHHGEYGGGCTDSQREGQDREEGKGRRSAQATNSVLGVAEKVGDQVSITIFDLWVGRCCHNGLISIPIVPARD